MGKDSRTRQTDGSPDLHRSTSGHCGWQAPPCLTLLCQLLPRPFSQWYGTHTEACEGQAAPLSALGLWPLLILAYAIKTAFLLAACPPALLLKASSLPRRTMRLKWEKGCVPASCRLCVAACQGKGVAGWCDTLDYTG